MAFIDFMLQYSCHKCYFGDDCVPWFHFALIGKLISIDDLIYLTRLPQYSSSNWLIKFLAPQYLLLLSTFPSSSSPIMSFNIYLYRFIFVKLTSHPFSSRLYFSLILTLNSTLGSTFARIFRIEESQYLFRADTIIDSFVFESTFMVSHIPLHLSPLECPLFCL